MRAVLFAVLVLAACGDGDDDPGVTSDASDMDASADATTDAVPAEGPVTVTAYSWETPGSPATFASVVFAQPDGSVVATVPVDAQGVATAAVMAGGSVTVIRPNDSRLVTIFDVQPDDSLDAGPVTAQPGFDTVGSMAVTLPGDAATNGTYAIHAACAYSLDDVSTDRSLSIYDSCPAQVDVVALAFVDNRMVSFTAQADVPRETASVSLPAWRTDFLETLVTMPDDTPTLGYYLLGYTRAGGYRYGFDEGDLVGGKRNVRFPRGFADAYQLRAERFPQSGVGGRSAFAYTATTPPASFTVAAGDFLGEVTQPTWDPVTRTVAWTYDGDAGGLDGTLLA